MKIGKIVGSYHKPLSDIIKAELTAGAAVVGGVAVKAGGQAVVNVAKSPVGRKAIGTGLNLLYHYTHEGGGEIPQLPVVIERVVQAIERVFW